MVQVTLEDDKVGASKVEEEIGSLARDRPEGVSSAPEGMLLVHPLALLLVVLPAPTQLTQRSQLGIRAGREQGTVQHRVEKPVPVLARNVRDEPGEALAVEVDLTSNARLDKPIG